jgi:hypothetical protein
VKVKLAFPIGAVRLEEDKLVKLIGLLSGRFNSSVPMQ